MTRYSLLFCALLATLPAACGGSGTVPQSLSVLSPDDLAPKPTSPIKHVILMIQENRTFNEPIDDDT